MLNAAPGPLTLRAWEVESVSSQEANPRCQSLLHGVLQYESTGNGLYASSLEADKKQHYGQRDTVSFVRSLVLPSLVVYETNLTTSGQAILATSSRVIGWSSDT